MRAGNLDRRLTVLQVSSAKNGLGEKAKLGWVEYAQCWASFKPVSDGERIRAAAFEQKTDARFVVRWSEKMAAVTGDFRLRFEGSDWRISGIKEVGRRRWLEFTAWKVRQPEA